MPTIEVDFNNCDREGRVRLNTVGAIQSLNKSQVTLRNGLEVELTFGDFFPITGIVEYSASDLTVLGITTDNWRLWFQL